MTTPEHLDWHYLFSAALDEQLSPADADRLRDGGWAILVPCRFGIPRPAIRSPRRSVMRGTF